MIQKARNDAALRKQAAAAALQAAAQAESFDAMYQNLKEEIATILPDIDAKIQTKKDSERQRAQRQARLWRIETFDKNNDQVVDQVDQLNSNVISRRRNQLYQKFAPISSPRCPCVDCF